MTNPFRALAIDLIQDERKRQEAKYGLNEDLALGFGSSVSPYPWLHPYTFAPNPQVEQVFREDYESYSRDHGVPTWMHLIREEVAELFAAEDLRDVMVEATQVAALCVSLLERLFAGGFDDPQ